MARLTGPDWEQAKQMWASGSFSLSDIATRFNTSITSLHRRFKREGIEKGQNADRFQKAMMQAMENQAIQKAEELAQLAAQFKELHLKGVESLTKRTLLLIQRAAQEGRALATIEDDLKALEKASRILSTNYATAEKILHLNRDPEVEKELPELTIVRLTDEDVAELRRQQRHELEQLTGTVLPEGALEEALTLDAEVLEDE